MTKADKILIIIILFLVSFLFARNYKRNTNNINKTLVIYEAIKGMKSPKFLKFSLDKDKNYSFNAPTGLFVVQVQDGKVCVKKSSCPNKICIKHGCIQKPGQSIVCAPNKIALSIKSEKQDYDCDVITY